MRNRVLTTVVIILALGVIANGYFYYQESQRLMNTQARVVALEGNVAALTDNISVQIGSIGRDIYTLTTDISVLKGDTSIMKKDVSTLKTDTSAMKSSLSTLTVDTSSLGVNVAALNGNIRGLQQQVTNNFRDFQQYKSAGTDTVNRLSSAVVRVDVAGNGFAASGSGTIINKAGYVLTNEHVIDGAQTIKITVTGGDEYGGTVVNTDKDRDLAIVKIASSGGFQEVVLGSADDIVVGKEVLTIGFPLGRNFAGSATVTEGIVSAVRTFQGYRYIQTDAAINPGNSGGCMVTLDGKMIGIPSARIISPELQLEGIGLAIPIDEVRFFVQKTLGPLGLSF